MPKQNPKTQEEEKAVLRKARRKNLTETVNVPSLSRHKFEVDTGSGKGRMKFNHRDCLQRTRNQPS